MKKVNTSFENMTKGFAITGELSKYGSKYRKITEIGNQPRI